MLTFVHKAYTGSGSGIQVTLSAASHTCQKNYCHVTDIMYMSSINYNHVIIIGLNKVRNIHVFMFYDRPVINSLF